MSMERREIKDKVITALESIGACVFEDERDKDLNLADYILDSLLFVEFFVELESQFGIELPDNYLSMDKFKSINAFCISMEELLANKEDDRHSSAE